MTTPSTLIIQSYSTPVEPLWLQNCLESVADWSQAQDFDYRFIDDQLFDYLDPQLLAKLEKQKVIAIYSLCRCI